MTVIGLAKENDADLTFLYITDISFLERISSPVLIDIEQELDELGEFVLAMAQERAASKGVQVESIVRRGAFGAVLAAALEEFEIDWLILGSPVESTGPSTTMPYLESLARELAVTHGVRVTILRMGEAVLELP
jgi:nucleotide-binding universal stress UspA family protein